MLLWLDLDPLLEPVVSSQLQFYCWSESFTSEKRTGQRAGIRKRCGDRLGDVGDMPRSVHPGAVTLSVQWHGQRQLTRSAGSHR